MAGPVLTRWTLGARPPELQIKFKGLVSGEDALEGIGRTVKQAQVKAAAGIGGFIQKLLGGAKSRIAAGAKSVGNAASTIGTHPAPLATRPGPLGGRKPTLSPGFVGWDQRPHTSTRQVGTIVEQGPRDGEPIRRGVMAVPIPDSRLSGLAGNTLLPAGSQPAIRPRQGMSPVTRTGLGAIGGATALTGGLMALQRSQPAAAPNVPIMGENAPMDDPLAAATPVPAQPPAAPPAAPAKAPTPATPPGAAAEPGIMDRIQGMLGQAPAQPPAAPPAATPPPAAPGIMDRIQGMLGQAGDWAGNQASQFGANPQQYMWKNLPYIAGAGAGGLGLMYLLQQMRAKRRDRDEDDAYGELYKPAAMQKLAQEYPFQLGVLARCAEQGLSVELTEKVIEKTAAVDPKIGEDWQRFFVKAAVGEVAGIKPPAPTAAPLKLTAKLPPRLPAGASVLPPGPRQVVPPAPKIPGADPNSMGGGLYKVPSNIPDVPSWKTLQLRKPPGSPLIEPGSPGYAAAVQRIPGRPVNRTEAPALATTTGGPTGSTAPAARPAAPPVPSRPLKPATPIRPTPPPTSPLTYNPASKPLPAGTQVTRPVPPTRTSMFAIGKPATPAPPAAPTPPAAPPARSNVIKPTRMQGAPLRMAQLTDSGMDPDLAKTVIQNTMDRRNADPTFSGTLGRFARRVPDALFSGMTGPVALGEGLGDAVERGFRPDNSLNMMAKGVMSPLIDASGIDPLPDSPTMGEFARTRGRQLQQASREPDLAGAVGRTFGVGLEHAPEAIGNTVVADGILGARGGQIGRMASGLIPGAGWLGRGMAGASAFLPRIQGLGAGMAGPEQATREVLQTIPAGGGLSLADRQQSLAQGLRSRTAGGNPLTRGLGELGASAVETGPTLAMTGPLYGGFRGAVGRAFTGGGLRPALAAAGKQTAQTTGIISGLDGLNAAAAPPAWQPAATQPQPQQTVPPAAPPGTPPATQSTGQPQPAPAQTQPAVAGSASGGAQPPQATDWTAEATRLREMPVTPESLQQMDPAEMQGMAQRADQIRQGWDQIPPDQQPGAAEFVVRTKAMEHVRGTGKPLDDVMAKMESDGWDQQDVQQAFNNFTKENLAAANPQFLGSFLEGFGKMDSMSKAALVMGIPLAIAGLLSTFFGEGGLMGLLATIGGLGAAGYAAYSNNLGGFGDNVNQFAQDAVLGMSPNVGAPILQQAMNFKPGLREQLQRLKGQDYDTVAPILTGAKGQQFSPAGVGGKMLSKVPFVGGLLSNLGDKVVPNSVGGSHPGQGLTPEQAQNLHAMVQQLEFGS